MDRETAIENILDNFDFDRVKEVMKALNWTWYDSEEPPTFNKLYKSAEKYLEETYDKCLLYKKDYQVGSGGFYCVASYNDAHQEVDYINLYFQVTNCDYFISDNV